MTATKDLTGLFYFDPADRIYTDHFPGTPIVPGSVIIHAFFSALANHKIDASNGRVTNFRFKKFISPGEYRYTISTGPSKYSCRLYTHDKAAVTGEILLCS